MTKEGSNINLDIDIIPRIVSLRSNVSSVPQFHLLSHNPGKSAPPPSEDTIISAGYFVDSDHPLLTNPPVNTNGFSEASTNKIYFQRTIGGGLKAKMLVEFHDHDHFDIYTNKIYHRASNITIDKFYSVGWHLRDLLQYCLLNSGYTLLHSACFEYQGEGILILALSDVGKTTTTVNFLKKGANYVAEDLSVTDGESIYTCPYTFGYGDLSRYIDSPFANLYEGVHRWFPLIDHIVSSPGNVYDLAGQENMLQSVNIDRIFILNKGQNATKAVTSDQAKRMALSQNRAELLYHASPLLSISEFIDINIDIFDAIAKEEAIFTQLFKENNEIHQLSGHPDYFERVIRQKVNK